MRTKSIARALFNGAAIGSLIVMLGLGVTQVFNSYKPTQTKAEGFHAQINGEFINIGVGQIYKGNSISFGTDPIVNGQNQPVVNLPITFTLTRPDSSTVSWIQRTDGDGRIKGLVYQSVLNNIGQYQLSAAGTGVPSNNRSVLVSEVKTGQRGFGSGVTSVVESVPTGYQANIYRVTCTANYNTTCYITNKTATNFTINVGTGGPGDNSGLVDYSIDSSNILSGS